MAVTYAKLWPRFESEIVLDDDGSQIFNVQRVLFFDPVLERIGTTSLGQRLRLISPAVRECELLILRGLHRDDFRLLDEEIDFVQRLTRASKIYLLIGGPPTPSVISVLGTPHAKRKIERWLPTLRQIEFEAIIQRTGAAFRDHGIHYLLPSGYHSASFLRIADALQDPTEVSRLADWVAQHVEHESILIGDNGSLLSLLLTVRDRVKLFGNIDVHIRTLSAYPLSAQDVEPLLDDVLTRYPGKRLLFIVSVSASGTLARRLLALAPPSSRVLVICNAGLEDDGLDSLHRCRINYLEPDNTGKCTLCSSSHLIGIDPRTYERIPDISYEVRSINTTAARRHSPFWEAVERTGAIKLHYNFPISETLVRHHGVYIDVAALLKDSWFRGLVTNTLGEKLSPPSLLLVPDHSASDAVIDVVIEVFRGVHVVKVARDRLPPAATKRISQLTSGQTILVADDALVQGTTITALRYLLYPIIQGMKASPSVKAFVCIARTDNHVTFNNSVNPFRDGSGLQFYHAYRLHLPTSGEDHCPWCIERALLSQFAPRLDIPARDTAIRRRDALDAGELGDRFLWDSEDVIGSEITKDSFFGQLGLKTAFAAATAATQELRLELAGVKGAGKAAVMDLPMALANYFDPVLLSAMLRTLEIRELYYLAQDQHVRAALARFPIASAYPGLVAELGWAAINNKLPRGTVQRALREVKNTSDIRLLLAIMAWQQSNDS